MCTVSWIHTLDGYSLLCNRDEKRTRSRAVSPRIHMRRGTRYVSPLDGDFGGTWLAANEYGITLCLLNGALGDEAPAHRPERSRGLLLPEVIDAPDAWEVCERVWHTDLSPYAPFTLAILEPGEPARVVEWNGERKSVFGHADSLAPLISSSIDPTGVRCARRAAYQALLAGHTQPTIHSLERFHRHHGGRPSAYSTCMHRVDAGTVSYSHVTVSSNGIRLHYAAGAPCARPPVETVTLDRRL